jgi:RHS repeat-associated protein
LLGVIGYSGTVNYDRAYAPFGEPYNESSTTNRDFTGQTQDTTPGIYDFLLRQYSPSQGRWQVPDPSGMAAVDITNPQTWNRYAYVANNPLSNVDPLGLKCGLAHVPYEGTIIIGGCGSGFLGGEFSWADPTAEGFTIPTDPEGNPQGYVVVFPIYGNWDLASLLGQVVLSPWYTVTGSLEGRGRKGQTQLNSTTSYGLNPSTDIFVALPDTTLMGDCVDVQTPSGYASGVPVGDVGPWNGGGTRSNPTAFNDPYWSPGTPGSSGFQPPETSTGVDLRGRQVAQYSIGAGIDISYGLQQQLGLTGNSTVSWRFAPCQ